MRFEQRAQLHTRNFILILLFSSILPVSCQSYNTPNSAAWPQDSEWAALGASLSLDASLTGPITNPNPIARQCRKISERPFALLTGGNGLCMQTSKCIHQFCDQSREYAFPAYAVDVRTDEDIASIVQFAATHNIEVSVKSTGHSYHGSSLVPGSILVSMRNFPKDGSIVQNFTDSCGSNHGTALGIGGGEIFDDVLRAVGRDYHIVTGGCRTVGAAGGWLQGSGLSQTCRHYGLGVDQVLDFRVVLASGEVVVADRCSHPDLFWALRGGGGGTFGVVTHVNYKVHPRAPLIMVLFNPLALFYPGRLLGRFNIFMRFIEQFFEYWIEVSPTLDSRWGGFFGSGLLILGFVGTREEARETLLDDFDQWYNEVLELPFILRPLMGIFRPMIMEYDSWYDYSGGDSASGNGLLSAITSLVFEYGVARRAARLVPTDVIESQPTELKDLLLSLFRTGDLANAHYLLGGNVNNVPVNATAVHPALRRAAWNLFSFGEEGNKAVRDFMPNNVTGVCYNHHYAFEPDWRNASWGSNYERLVMLKEQYDPDHRFNAWHGVGYVGEEPEVPNDNYSLFVEVLDWILGLVGLRWPRFLLF